MSDLRLQELRREIDVVDDQLVALLADRAALVREVWALKRAIGQPLRDPQREAAIFERAHQRSRARELHPQVLQSIMEVLVGRDLAQPMDGGHIAE